MSKARELMDAALASAAAKRGADLADLFEELRIPSVSTLPERRADCVRNARWLQGRLDMLGMETRLLDVSASGLPLVVGDWRRQPGKPHLTIYGHYDVQPPDPLAEWESPPFEPEIRDGQIYARGCADSKGNHMATIKAVEHLFAMDEPPVNLRFIFEGEEEMFGDSLPRFLHANASELKTDAVLLWDGIFDEDDCPTLASTLRGLLYVELRATGARVDLHSGMYGGVAPNAINTLARILTELKGRDGHINIPGFYDAVRPPSAEERAGWRRSDGAYTEAMRRMSGARALEGETEFLARERATCRPALDANGIIGGFVGEGKKTVIPARASAKVSLRLVPDQDWRVVLASLEQQVRELTTPGVDVKVDVLGAAPPVTCGVDHLVAKALRAAYLDTLGKDTKLIRIGGSIPVAVDFQEALGAPLVISGLTQADAAVHSPNEHLVLDHYYRGIDVLIRFICTLAE